MTANIFRNFRILTACTTLLWAAWAGADSLPAGKSLYVQSAKAQLQEAPDFKSAVVASAVRGSSLEPLELSGSWIKVRLNDQVGWVSKLVLSEHPPVDKKSVLQGNIQPRTDNVRRRASTTATAAATRGLRGEDRSRASDKGFADYQALEQMESNTVDEEAIDKFNPKNYRDTTH